MPNKPALRPNKRVPTGFHVGSPAVLSIACISNKVNHAFNMTNTTLDLDQISHAGRLNCL